MYNMASYFVFAHMIYIYYMANYFVFTSALKNPH